MFTSSIVFYKSYPIELISKYLSEEVVFSSYRVEVVEETKERISKLIFECFGETSVVNWGLYVDAVYGIYIKIISNLKASDAIRGWEKLVDKLDETKLTRTVFVEWLGEIDLDPMTLGYRIGKILAKMGVKLATESPTDFVKIVSDLRE